MRGSLARTGHMTSPAPAGAVQEAPSYILPWAWEDKEWDILAKSSRDTSNSTPAGKRPPPQCSCALDGTCRFTYYLVLF